MKILGLLAFAASGAAAGEDGFHLRVVGWSESVLGRLATGLSREGIELWLRGQILS